MSLDIGALQPGVISFHNFLKLISQVLGNVFQCLIHYTDVAVDLSLCYGHFSSGKENYFLLTLFIMLLPNLMIFVISSIFKISGVCNNHEKKGETNDHTLTHVLKHVTLILICSVFNLFILLG